jgi:hypothetical protein
VKLWQIAKFLEEIPSRMPFARHPYSHIMPVEEFSRRDVFIYTTWLLAWFLIGVTGVGFYNSIAGLSYLVLGPSAYLFYLYLTCTKCPYYGKQCYMGGGQCAKKIFKPREGDYTLLEDLIVPALWIGVSAYPVIFLLYYKSWLTLLAFLVTTLGWQVFHKRNVCSKCLNVKCGLNPRFVGRSGRVQIMR